MAKTRMITRTVTTTEYTALCLDINTAEPCNRSVSLPGVIKDAEKKLAAVKAAIDTDSLKAVSIVNESTAEYLYGMPEDDFIRIAQILPARGSNTKTEESEEN